MATYIQSPASPKPRPQRQPRSRQAPQTQQKPNQQPYARQLWAASQPIPQPTQQDLHQGHPVRLWLAQRNLLHPWQSLPRGFRWYPQNSWILVGLWPIDTWTETWPDTPSQPPVAVHALAIDNQGLPVNYWTGKNGKQRNKTSFGPMSEGILALGPPHIDDPMVLAVEGVADALALYSRKQGLVLTAIAKVGSIDHRPGIIDYLQKNNKQLAIYPDQDKNNTGQHSATLLAQRLQALRIPHIVQKDSMYGDPAEWAAGSPWPTLDIKTFANQVRDHMETGMPRTEADRLVLQALEPTTTGHT